MYEQGLDSHGISNFDVVSGGPHRGCAVRTWNRDMSSELTLSRAVRVRSDRVSCWVLVLGRHMEPLPVDSLL